MTGISGNTLSIYDPYLYSGKFTTASRKAANVTVKGNTVYVSVENFKKYANCKSFFSYKYDADKVTSNNTTVTTTTSNTTTSSVKTVNYQVKVNASIGLNIRSGASTNYSIVGGYTYGTTVTITKETGNWGKTDKGWICLDYVSKISTNTKSNNIIANEVLQGKWGNGTTRKSRLTAAGYDYNTIQAIVNQLCGTNSTASKTMTVTAKIGLNVRSGPGTGYKIVTAYPYGTRVTVLSVTGNWARTDKGYMCLTYLK